MRIEFGVLAGGSAACENPKIAFMRTLFLNRGIVAIFSISLYTVSRNLNAVCNVLVIRRENAFD
jgi:hypothetical protein